MAKFLITSGSHFDPFTYDELAKPVIQTVEAHNATQDAYDAISMETAALAQYLSENEDDTKARALYNNYMGRLQNLQNNLWNNGYSAAVRRDLSSARTGYFQEIGKLKNAIERRQKESDLYREMRLKDRDAIMGRDPGTYGLDDYLGDQNFGRDWYSYSGKEFEASVGAEVKARAAALKSKAAATRDPDLAWVINRLETEGFTNSETDEAGRVVDEVLNMTPEQRDAFYKSRNTSTPVQILVESLLNRYDSVGARDAELTDSERARLLGYGKAGFAQGVLGTKSVNYEDEVYKEDAEKRKMAYQSGLRMNEQDHQAQLTRGNMILEAMLKGGGNGSGLKTDANGNIQMGSAIQLTAPTYEEYVKSTERQSKYYRNGPIQLTGPDGTSSKTVFDEYQMADEVYGTKERESIRRQFGGYDIALSPKQNGDGFAYTAPDGTKFNLDIHTPDPDERKKYGLDKYGPSAVIVYDKDNKEVWEAGTESINRAIVELNNQVAGYKSQNSTLDLDKMMVTPKQQQEIRKNETGLEPTASWNEVHDYLNAMHYNRMGSTISITGFEKYNDDARENMGRAIKNQYDYFTASAGKNGKLGVDSRIAIHEVGKGGTVYSEGATTDLASVLGSKDGVINTKAITDVSVVLEDFMHGNYGAKDGSAPMVRFTTEKHPGKVFATEPIAFGPVADNIFNGLMPMSWNPQVSWESRQAYPYMSESNQIAFLLEPCFNPAAARRMTKQESEDWGYMANQILGTDANGDYLVPHFTRADGKETPATAKEVASNKNLREKIEYAVTVKLAVPTMGKFLDAVNKH